MSRIEPVLSEINSTMDTEDQMLKIMQTLNDTVTPIPDVGGFYTFIYNAKTPRIQYDQHPLIVCAEVFRWGFYVVQPDELDDLVSIQYGLLVTK